MPLERTEAVVMRGVDFSETSRIVTLLTPTRGRLACIAKGARRAKSGLAAVLDTFNRVELAYYWKEGRAIQTMSDATLLNGFGRLKTNLEKATYAAFPLEVAYKVSRDNEPSHLLYSTLVKGLEALERFDGEIVLYAAWHVLHLLAAAGFGPSLDRCCRCGAVVGASAGFAYDGGVTCRRCRGDRRLSAHEYGVLRAVWQHNDQCPDAAEAPGVFDAVRCFASRQLETDFRSLRVIKDVFG